MNSNPFVVGCVQVSPGEDKALNLTHLVEGVLEAKRQGAVLVALPEYASFLHASGSAMRANAEDEQVNPSLPKFQKLASEQETWLLVGSLALTGPDERLVNRSYLLSPSGSVVAAYTKIHMFDATLKNGRVIRESSAYAPGDQAVVAGTPWAKIGLSVCYDVRFPPLYRALAQAGAEVLAIPSAFTRQTGLLHWKALLQARAIENGAYVIAPATCGDHPGGHQTYGHAMIIDPNGQILAEAGESPQVICATIDLEQVGIARSRIPSLTHDRPFEVTQAV